ncbi:beta-galactosidase-like isoform X2 [Crassostrea angulata]|uniref:beta-galactosidase-like isoform X2 n=1 Tax=Magallana angulata TaxID=2784310 RepID=UPI0022B10D14|nr:beta-galactosidase-like isoform X2 [Crassostrea angulata]
MTEKMAATRRWIFLSCCIVCLLSACQLSQAQNRTFEIDYLGNTFVKDGKAFRYVSGSIHYMRVPKEYWRDRLEKMYAAGLDAIQFYIPWNYHEPEIGQYNFEGQRDFVQFIKLAQEVGLLVLIRAGPYICGEWEFGGFPAWLLKENPKMVLRKMDPTYIKYVDTWMDKLLPMLTPLMYENGGPILMVQIENEYGSFYTCDHDYMAHLRDKAREHLGPRALLYTTDGSGDGFLKCGTVPGAYVTVDFGNSFNPQKSFQPQRDYEPFGPLVNSEFYPGWLDHWGYPHSTVNLDVFSKALDLLLDYGANVNMYMFEGGTNFGFWNGADYDAAGSKSGSKNLKGANYAPYQAVPTSYDYDAPLTEAGDITDKYIAIRQVISKYKQLPSMPIPKNTTKTAYGKVEMSFMATVQDALQTLCPKGPIKSQYPLTMEAIGQWQGFVLYRHTLLGDTPSEPKTLDLSGVRDRAYLMINQVPQGIFDRNGQKTMNLTLKVNETIDILVENMGHIGFGSEMNNNSKGLISNVTFGGSILTGWSIFPLTVENFKPSSLSGIYRDKPFRNGNLTTPSFYVGKLHVPKEPSDTFLDMSAWGKGQNLIMSSSMINVGRYWPYVGPQVRLYVPKPFLAPSPTINYIIMFELEQAPCDTADKCTVEFVDQALINAAPHKPNFEREETVFSRKRISV